MGRKILLSYIAGVFDSDGCFSIIKSFNRKGNKKSTTWCAWAQIAQINNKAIKIIRKTFRNVTYSELTRNGRIFYRTIFTGEKAYNLIEELLPYLYIKKQQAKLLLKLRPLLGERPKVKIKVKTYNKRWKCFYRGTFYKLSKNQIDKRNKLVKKVRLLNGTM